MSDRAEIDAPADALPAAAPMEDAALGARASRVRIYIASFLIDASTYSYSMALSVHAESRMSAGYWQLGKLGAISALCYSVACLLTGGLSDRLGSLPLAFASLALLSAGFVGTQFVRTYEHLLIANAFMGAALALFWPAIQRKLSRLSPGRALWGILGVFNVVWALGVAAGTLATPAVYAAAGLTPTLLLGLVLTVAAIPLLAVEMREPPSQAMDARVNGGVGPLRARLFLRLAWVANFTAFFALVGLIRIFPRVSSDLGISLEWIGWVLVPLDMGKIGAFALLTRWPAWHYSAGWLFAAQAAAGAALVVAGVAEIWWLFVLLFPVVGALSGLTYYSSIYYSLNLREGEGKKSGLHETVLSSGVCFGPLLCGWVGDFYRGRPGAALIFGGLVLFTGLLIQLTLLGRARHELAREASRGSEGGAVPTRSES